MIEQARQVIFNADDFGLDPATNAAVCEAHKDGILTSTSLMVNGPSSVDGIALLRQLPKLDVGLHLTLSDGLPSLPAREIPALLNKVGRFHADPAMAGLRAFFIPSVRRQVELEVAQQFRIYEKTGLPLSHINGHQHLHIHPVIWKALIPRSVELGCKWVRIPNEEWWPTLTPNCGLRRCEWAFFKSILRSRKRSLHRHNLRTPDRVYGHVETGRMSEDCLLKLLPRISVPVAEVYLHPGAPHAFREPGSGQDVEAAALLSVRVRDLLARLGVQRARFSDIV